MADSDARLIWELYAAALKHEPAARGRYLERACDNPELRAQVARLLESHGLDIGASPTRSTQSHSPTGLNLAGERIGTYAIRRELGRGPGQLLLQVVGQGHAGHGCTGAESLVQGIGDVAYLYHLGHVLNMLCMWTTCQR